ncbi:MAG TPA: hypothetical protein VGF59_32805 [Bryobacteraceae bacterium]|jgi:hypothetical protein
MKIERHALGLVSAAAALVFGIAALAQSDSRSGQSIEGAWQASITLPPGMPYCAPAGALATRDGLVLAESCYASEGAGYGAWTRTGNREFAVTFTGNSFGTDGTVAARYKVRASVTLASNGNSFSGPYSTQFFDLSGNPTDSFSGTVTGTRQP